MWARRALRAGWLLAPILQFPGKLWNFFFKTTESTIITFIVGGIISGVTSCTAVQWKNAQPATPEEIKFYLTSNKERVNRCMINWMPELQTNVGVPLTVGHLKQSIKGCIDANKNYDIKQAQKAALEALKP